MKNIVLLGAICSCLCNLSSAQGTLKGKLVDSAQQKPLGLATVTVFKASDTVIITYRLSNPDGEFKVPGIPFGLGCRVVVSYSGYSVYRKEFNIKNDAPVMDIGTIKLSPVSTSLDEVIVYAERPPVIIKKDTVEFNASAFKTLPNALVEDLLKKLPGVQVDKEGNIVVNGKPVNRILVDGKTFFGDDPKMATRNLPANVIDKVQVTDDKEEMLRNGDDNPNNVGKVVNITLKKNIKKGWFGKLYAGGGTQGIYEAGGIANIYRDTLQVSVLGYLNNMNKPGFSLSEMMQTGGFQRNNNSSYSSSIRSVRNSNGSGVTINGINFGGISGSGGISTSKGIGFNLNHTPNTKRSFFIQYFRGNINVNRRTVTSITQYNSDTAIDNNTALTGGLITNAHSIGLGAKLKPDSVTTLLVNANYMIGLQDEQRISDVESINDKLGPLSNGNIFQNNPAHTYIYRHNIYLTKLSKTKKGRRFNFFQGLEINNRFNDYSTESALNFYYPAAFDSVAAQLRIERIPRTDASVSFNYSEPISKLFTLRIGARYEYSQLYNTVNTFNKNNSTNKFDVPNATLSSRFNRIGNRFIANPGLEFKWKKLTIIPVARILLQYMNNEFASLPNPILQRTSNVLPSLSIVYKGLTINYSKDIQLPGYTFLIPVNDNTNPYFISKGNPLLLPIERNNFSMEYYYNNTKSNLYINLYTSGALTGKDIVQSITLDDRGVQTTMPVNANGSKNFSMNFNIDKQYKSNPKFIYSWNTGSNFNYNRNKLLFNNVNSLQTTVNFSSWVGIGLNFNDKLEWNSSLNLGYNFTNYTNPYFKKINIRQRWFENELVVRWPKHVIWETQYNQDYLSSLPSGSRIIRRWNAAVNFTMLKSEALVLKLSVFDILKTNRNQYALVNRNMITRVETNTLPQYFMTTITYNVRPNGIKKKVGGKERLFLF